jgi:hypothetical protein
MMLAIKVMLAVGYGYPLFDFAVGYGYSLFDFVIDYCYGFWF